MEMKYFKPQSLSWWASVVPLVVGLIIATVDLHGMVPLVTSLQLIVGDATPAILINAGLLGIGLRGATA